MFSYLSRGYGTWEGIAKLEKPDSAIEAAAHSRRYHILPPIEKDQTIKFYENVVDPEGKYKANNDHQQLKLPAVVKTSLHVPKTYTTKRGALLLYSECCFVPGSRRLKKRPRIKRNKEKQLKTLKELIELIMNYKKNGCDPLLLEQLWRKMNGNTRELQPGYSPKQYLNHLSNTTFDEESLKRLIESGSLKGHETLEDSFLPALISDGYGLNHRPQPYKTMSLPPVSPSSSLLGSFTFYNNALSTGAASMVTLPSMDVESVDEQLSQRTVGTFVESLAERLAEVESENGFKKDYESLSSKEKEDILTQLLMDITLHSKEEVLEKPMQTKLESSSDQTELSYLGEVFKELKSSSTDDIACDEKADSMMNSNKTSFPSKKSCSNRPTSGDTVHSSDRKSAQNTRMSTFSLPPINIAQQNYSNAREASGTKSSLSGSGSGLGLLVNNLENGETDFVDVEMDETFKVDGVEKGSTTTRSSQSMKTTSDHSLVSAVSMKDGDSPHHDDENDTTSLTSFAGAFVDGSDGIEQGVMNDDVDHPAERSELNEGTGSTQETENIACRDGEPETANNMEGSPTHTADQGKIFEEDRTASDDDHAQSVDHEVLRSNDEAKQDDEELSSVSHTSHDPLQISLSNLQDELRLVATEVLSRPKSGRVLAEDAQVASCLLLERIRTLLGPAITDDKERVRSAAVNTVRPLGEVRKTRRPRSAHAAISLTIPHQPVCLLEEKRVGPVSVDEKDEECLDTNSVPQDGVTSVVEPVPDDEMKRPDEQIDQLPTIQVINETELDLTKTVLQDKTKSQKGGKAKKLGNKKRTGKGKKKKQPAAHAQSELSKTPPFRAGLVPEPKPPKGLTQKAGGSGKKGNGSPVSLGVQEQEVKTQGQVMLETPSPPVAPLRVDSETREIEKKTSPTKSESRRGSKNSQSQGDDASLSSERKSSRDQSSRESTSPREPKACPRDRDAVFPENASAAETGVETAEPSMRDPSPEIVLTEKQRRANARAAQRAAAAERRRQEVERKRREREEARRHAQEEEARLELLRKEAEEEMKKREDERRIQREAEERERNRLEAEERERSRQERLVIEREKQEREDWKRKKEQLIAQRKFEEELRMERERVDAQIEEERRKEYEEKIAHLEEEERERLMQERRIEEERIKREIQEEKERREAERSRMLEERRLMEEELAAAKERQLARRDFLETLLKDFQYLLLEQRISRAFTFSYFDILPWLKDRFKDVEEDRPMTSQSSLPGLDTVREENEFDVDVTG